MIAKRDSAQRWGDERVPTLRNWEAGMNKSMAMERVIYKGRGCPRKFDKIWGSWAEIEDQEIPAESADMNTMMRNNGNMDN